MVAGVWLLPCVDPFMHLKVAQHCKIMFTILAGEGLLPSVDHLMFLKAAKLVTMGAGVCIFLCVDSHMFLHDAILGGRLVTMGVG